MCSLELGYLSDSLFLSHVFSYIECLLSCRMCSLSLDIIFQAVAQEHGISTGDFPPTEIYRERLVRWTGTGRTLANLPKLNRDLIRKLDDCLSNEIPTLLRPLAVGQTPDEVTRPKYSEAPAFSSAFQVGRTMNEDEATVSLYFVLGLCFWSLVCQRFRPLVRPAVL